MRSSFVTGMLLVALLLSGCRDHQSEKTPFHPNLDMDFQEKFQAQERNPFFEDEAAMRRPPTGTVARGHLRDSSELYAGRTPEGSYVERVPIAVTQEVMERGQERYNIYCAPCHGRTGDGNGVVTSGNYSYTPAPSYHQDRLREVSDGYLYDVISNGVRTMPPYGYQVPVKDRWAIVAYIRALQRSQNAPAQDLPESQRFRLGVEESGASAE